MDGAHLCPGDAASAAPPHGIFSAQQTLGWTQSRASYVRAKAIGHAVALLIVVGFLLPPLAILFRIIGD